TFDVPPPSAAEPLVPALCFTTRAAPSMRCQMAIGGARPMTVTPVETVPGVASSRRLDITIDATLDVDAALARVRPGATGRDLWVVMRATGDVGLFPVIPFGLDSSTSLTSLVDTGDTTGNGVPALAFTNPVFVDVDGGGWRAPFAP